MPSPPPSGCPIPGSIGCVSAVGPIDAPILFVAEAAGHWEAYKGIPLIGDAGGMFDRMLGYANIDRRYVRIANCLWCHPPKDWLVGAPWEQAALDHCLPKLQEVLNERHPVVVTLGATALRQVLDLKRARGKEPARVQDFHGAPLRDPLERSWVVPTFHPSHLQRGMQKLTKTVVFDLSVAKELAEGRWEFDQPRLVIDPPVEQFKAWIDQYLQALQGNPNLWLAVDVETPDKGKKGDEGELGQEDKSYEILYINLSWSREEGITVPWRGAYIAEAKRALEAHGTLAFWNAPYDVPRLRVQGVRVDQARVLDFMDAWHVLQSALPRGLGFVAPFYSKTGPWKHRGNLDGVYRAMDGVQTIRCAEGIAEDLQQEGMWEVFTRHCWEYDTYVLRPAERVGLGLNREELGKFSEELKGECARLAEELSKLVPEEVRPLAGPLKRRPEGEEGIVEQREQCLVQVCTRCGAEEVAKSHRCADLKAGKRSSHGVELGKSVEPGSEQDRERNAQDGERVGCPPHHSGAGTIALEERRVSRFYRREPFNPASWQQILAYIKWKGHKPGRAKKTGKESSDKKTLERLLKTGDPFYRMVLDHRQAGKMEGTYGSGILEKLDSQDRIHTTFTHVPSTLRLSSTGPNLQNLASHVKYAAGFRRCVEAKPGHLLMSFDKSGVEAVMVGWFSRDPNYIRLAKLGVHAFVQSHVLVHERKIKEAADLSWSDCTLREFFADLKKRYPAEYDKSKRCVHGYNYGLTEFGMAEYYPEVFPKRADAAKLIAIYTEVCPKLARWHSEVLKAADQRKYLGGPGEHPFGYKHHFYSVIEYRRARGGWKEYQGEDAKRAKAFLPQSTAAGDIAEDALILFNQESPQYIGDLCEGDTPLRALIHDEFFFEVPEGQAGKLYERVQEVMTRVVPEMPCPAEWDLGEHLSIGVSAKVGRNWAPYNDDPKRGAINLQGMKAEGPENLAADDFYLEEEEEEVPE